MAWKKVVSESLVKEIKLRLAKYLFIFSFHFTKNSNNLHVNEGKSYIVYTSIFTFFRLAVMHCLVGFAYSLVLFHFEIIYRVFSVCCFNYCFLIACKCKISRIDQTPHKEMNRDCKQKPRNAQKFERLKQRKFVKCQLVGWCSFYWDVENSFFLDKIERNENKRRLHWNSLLG